ncbi:MAG: hypothetical protein LBN04_01835 [Oscillospiraceae bacterium]|jgi:putative aldouronate transport system substrate-binding protein|nr:hypothetical protein [Oscillospiraceae bacterium]
MKKLLSLSLALVLLLSSAAALAELDLSQYVSDPNEKITIAWLAGHNTQEVHPEDPVLLWLNEKFNVDIQPIFIERENYDELLTTRIMGGEVPDVFMLQDAAQFSKYVDQGVAMEVPIEIIQQCMPESYAWLIEYDPLCFSAVSYAGKNYGLPRVNGDGRYNYAPFWRADWLAKFGYTDGKVPMTLEEAEAVFYSFANEDPDGNGVKDTYALSNTGMNPIFGAFGALPDRWVKGEDGKLVYGAVHPGMKDALTLLSKWYADGLIDPEFITGENQGGYWALSVPFENGQIGFSSSGAYYHLAPDFDGEEGTSFQFGRTMRTFAATVGYDKMVIGYNPVGYDGKTQGGESWGLTTSESIVFSYKLADQPEKLARILEVINTIGSDYDTWLKVWSWDLNQDKYTYDPLLGYVKVEGYVVDTTYGENQGNMFNTLQNPNFAAKYKPANFDWANSMPMFLTGGYSNTMLPITTASMPDKWTSMETLRQTTFIQIITGEKSVDEYDAFVTQWYDMGGTAITDEANEWYLSK